MKRDTLTGLAIGAAAGLIIGYFVGAAHLFDGDAPAQPVVAASAAPIAGAASQLAAQQRILATEATLAQNPKNVEAWINLGNDCFDLGLAQKAVDAYSKALALAPNLPQAPGILTDQGVMYRKLQAFDKAIANFKQANKIDPTHTQSLYDMGIVYGQDLHNTAEALKAFSRVLEIAPGSPQAEQARKAIEELKATGAAKP